MLTSLRESSTEELNSRNEWWTLRGFVGTEWWVFKGYKGIKKEDSLTKE